MTPVKHIYRFRSIERLVDQDELQNQEIYFAKPDELNDPMEGFRDIFWHGDEVVWKNLLRHFLICLERAFALFCIFGEEHPIGWDKIPVLNSDTSSTAEQKALQNEIAAIFFGDDGVKACVHALSSRTLPIRRDELAFYLRILHMFAVSRIRECYEKHHLLPKQEFDTEMMQKLSHSPSQVAVAIENIKFVEKRSSVNEHNVDNFFAAQQRMMAELDLIHLHNKSIDYRFRNRNFVLLTFSQEYVNKLEMLVYPDWYTACFLQDCRNSSVWGSYGVNHTGICLKFKVSDVSGKPAIYLNRIKGVNTNGPIHGPVPHELFQIRYDNNLLAIDFFRSLGRLPAPTLKRNWYIDEDGKRSACADEIFSSERNWRIKHWDTFQRGITRKNRDWSFEQEYRLIFNGVAFYDFSDRKCRTATYNFADLDGVIFGIKTPIESKLKISKIIEEKCCAAKRTDFKFYQAYYSRESGFIEHAEMPLLRFESEGKTAA